MVKFNSRIRKDLFLLFDVPNTEVEVELTDKRIIRLEKSGNDIVMNGKKLYMNRNQYKQTKNNFKKYDIKLIIIYKNDRKIIFDLKDQKYHFTYVTAHVNNYNKNIIIPSQGYQKFLKNYINLAVKKHNSIIMPEEVAILNIVECMNKIATEIKILSLGPGSADFEIMLLRKFYETNSDKKVIIIFVGINTEGKYDIIKEKLLRINENITPVCFNNTYSQIGEIMQENENPIFDNINIVVSIQFQISQTFPASMTKDEIINLAIIQRDMRKIFFEKVLENNPILYIFNYYNNNRFIKAYLKY